MNGKPVSFDAQSNRRGAALVESSAIAQNPRIRNMTPRLLLAAVWLLSAFYMAAGLRRGWLAHDEGVLAQSAERVLLGEIPHHDFDELYTGGLSYLNAEAFRLFGTNLASMRYVMYFFFLAWVPALYYIASRFGPPWVAASFTLLAVAWSVPNYSTPMPSWYNLFLATFGVAALLRFLETCRPKWILLAGLCGGVSFLFKLSGLYYVAGAALFLWFREGDANERVTQRDRWYRTARAALFVLAYEAAVFSLLRKSFYPGSFLYFFLPILTVGAAVIWQQIQRRGQGIDFTRSEENLLIFAVGVAIPIALFLIPYLRAGAVADFVRGVFVLPGRRLQYTVKSASLARFLLGMTENALVWLAVLKTRGKIGRKIERAAGIALAAAALVAVALGRNHHTIFNALWVPLWNALPFTVIVGTLLLMTKARNIETQRRQKIFLLLAVTAACSLIQFPYTGPIYFCYVAPLLILSMLAVGSLIEEPPRWVLAGLFCFCLLYAVFDATPTFLRYRGELDVPPGGVADFVLPRSGSLHLYGPDARLRAELVQIIAQHALGSYIYATPDCPDVYFLSGFRNPTRTLFDFLDEPQGRTQRILAAIHAHNVNLVVIYLTPGFSGPIPADLREELEKEFPEQAQIPDYEVRWKP